MTSPTTFFFFLFVAGCLSDLNITKAGDIQFGETVNFTIPASNLYDEAQFTLHSKVAIAVCIQEQYLPPGPSQFSNQTCTFFKNLTQNAVHTFSVPLRNVQYHVGLYFASSNVSPSNKTSVSIEVTGQTCAPQWYYDEVTSTCVKSEVKSFETFSVTINEGAESTLFYEIQAPELLGNLICTVKQTPESSAVSGVLRLRQNAAPSATNSDADDMFGPAKIVSPRPGLWVLGFEPREAGVFEITISGEECAETGRAGDGCDTPYEDAMNNMTLLAFPNKFRFFHFQVTSNVSLNVSVTTLDHQNIPILLVLQGNIPTPENAQISNCNQDHCNVVKSIHIPASPRGVTQNWFIGVSASVPEGNTSYGIWFNTTCAPECETDNHGYCEVDGTCTCQLDFSGVDCAISTGLGAQYIVLIIIAALVVASAVIGFIAWAYMRRKRVNYELVS